MLAEGHRALRCQIRPNQLVVYANVLLRSKTTLVLHSCHVNVDGMVLTSRPASEMRREEARMP